MQGIDRRAKDRLVAFTLTHPERYGSLDTYRSDKGHFRELARSLVPPDWKVGEAPGIWCEIQAPELRVPDGGFKIHLSTTHDKARELFTKVVPILVEEGVTFKVLVDEKILDLSNSTFWGRGACGKFITIYPFDAEHLKRLVTRLHEITKDFRGPYILSDKRLKGSNVLFYRYGAFRKAQRVNVFGEPLALVKTADGQLIPDMRLAYFNMPEGVADPFPDTEEEDDGGLLNGRYEPLASLGSSSKGGVYKCLDTKTNTEVVVKEARPHINRGRKNPFDAVDCLKNEYRVLTRLESTGITPKPIEAFEEWEHSFVAMEMVKGIRLGAYLGAWRSSIILVTEPTAEDVRQYGKEFIALARKILAGARLIHERGVVIQDVSPRNILIDPEDGSVKFIDFEAAYVGKTADDSVLIPIYTPGFGEARDAGQEPTVADDYRALSRLMGELLYPPTPFFALAPGHRGPILSHFAKEKGVPEAFVRFILGIGEQPEKADELLAEAEASLKDVTDPKPLVPLRTEGDLRVIIDRIGDYIVSEIKTGSDPLELPMDYRRFTTNRLSVAYGVSGIAHFLKRTRGEVPEEFLNALVSEAAKIDNNTYAPGLYLGSAGVAWTLLELGKRKEAEALLETAAQSPILFENADLFYGASGWGLTNLFFFGQLGDEKYLKNAVEAFAQIKPKLKRENVGYSYENTDAIYHSLGHGPAGIGHFMLQLHRVTGQEEHLAVAKGLLDYELSTADEDRGTATFRRSESEKVHFPYWRIGSAGIGAIALRFHAALGDARYLDIARKVARNLAGSYTVFPTNFSGMTGIGGFFVDMYQRTEEQEYLDEARRFADRVMLFAIEKPLGVVFPGEDLLRIATDFGTGSAGMGVFFHRIVAGGGIPYLDI